MRDTLWFLGALVTAAPPRAPPPGLGAAESRPVGGARSLGDRVVLPPGCEHSRRTQAWTAATAGCKELRAGRDSGAGTSQGQGGAWRLKTLASCILDVAAGGLCAAGVGAVETHGHTGEGAQGTPPPSYGECPAPVVTLCSFPAQLSCITQGRSWIHAQDRWVDGVTVPVSPPCFWNGPSSLRHPGELSPALNAPFSGSQRAPGCCLLWPPSPGYSGLNGVPPKLCPHPNPGTPECGHLWK